MKDKLNKILLWKQNKPSTNAKWAEDVKDESLHVKYDFQLKNMHNNCQLKLPLVQDELNKIRQYPEVVKYEIRKQLENDLSGKPLDEAIEAEFQKRLNYFQWKSAKLDQSIERLAKEMYLRESGFVAPNKNNDKKPVKIEAGVPLSRIRDIKGTTYYVDFDNGNDANDGLSTGNAWATLDKFTENARNSGDICIVRRGMEQAVSSNLEFTSDGLVYDPIIIEADFDNAWGDRVDLSSTATASLTFGSKTVTFSADISGVISVGDWIYASGDDVKNFAYEVASVSVNTVTLYLPYKGNQDGSGKTMFNIKSAPIWNTVTGDYKVNFYFDNHWKMQGLHLRGTNFSGIINMTDCSGQYLKDCIIEANGSSDYIMQVSSGGGETYLDKCRSFNYAKAIYSGSDGGNIWHLKDCLLDGNNVTGSVGINMQNLGVAYVEECELKNHGNADLNASGSQYSQARLYGRNLILGSASKVGVGVANSNLAKFFIEDFNGTPNDSRQFWGLATVADSPQIQSEIVKVRSGGSDISLKVTPTVELAKVTKKTWLKILEIPIYATTDSKTYTIYFASDDIGQWTDNPTADELWLEIEAWGHAVNNFRKITKSTGTVDFKTDTDFDQSLSVTVAPAQEGIAYLRVYYVKPKETGKTNIFYIDPIPVIT